MREWAWYIYLFETVISFPSDECPEVTLLGHVVVQLLASWETCTLFPTAFAATYIPAHTVQGLFVFLHILSNIYFLCLFDTSHSNRCEALISLWFGFAFPWRLELLSTDFMYLLAMCMPSSDKNIYSGPLTIFNWIIFIELYKLFIYLDINPLSDHYLIDGL